MNPPMPCWPLPRRAVPALPTGLTAINLSNNKLASCSSLAPLAALKTISLAGNQLTAAPALPAGSLALTSVDFSNNLITGVGAQPHLA